MSTLYIIHVAKIILFSVTTKFDSTFFFFKIIVKRFKFPY